MVPFTVSRVELVPPDPSVSVEAPRLAVRFVEFVAAESDRDPLNPLMLEKLMLVDPVDPEFTVKEVLVAVALKSTPPTLTVVVAESVDDVAVMVIIALPV